MYSPIIHPLCTHHAPTIHRMIPPSIHLVTLQWSNMAMENGPFIVSVDDLHIETLDFPVRKLLGYRRIGLEWLKAHSPTKCSISPWLAVKSIIYFGDFPSKRPLISDVPVSYNDSDTYPALYWNSNKTHDINHSMIVYKNSDSYRKFHSIPMKIKPMVSIMLHRVAFFLLLLQFLRQLWLLLHQGLSKISP